MAETEPFQTQELLLRLPGGYRVPRLSTVLACFPRSQLESWMKSETARTQTGVHIGSQFLCDQPKPPAKRPCGCNWKSHDLVCHDPPWCFCACALVQLHICLFEGEGGGEIKIRALLINKVTWIDDKGKFDLSKCGLGRDASYVCCFRWIDR